LNSARLLPVVVAVLALLGSAMPAAANEKYAAIVIDANTGQTLFARNADARRYPASLTKMMTLYVLFEELQAKRISLSSRLKVSANAAAQAPSKLGIKAGRTVKVEDAILALTTKSANDIAVVVAENVGGSVSGFAARMNRTAQRLGMRSTTFRNPHGLPNSGQVTTARDMARLGAALQDNFPTYYRYFGVKTFTYSGTRYRNHNRLLGSVAGVNGIKTGYTRASGFNLVTNVERDGRHIIAVVMGGRTGASRDAHMRELIAEYLPQAKRGSRSTPLVVADVVSDGDLIAAAAEEGESGPRLPKPRPGHEFQVAVASAAASSVEPVAVAAAEGDVESAAAAAADTESGADLVVAAIDAAPDGVGSKGTDEPADVIAERISTATAVAELAYVAPEGQSANDPVARLAEIAKSRTGNEEVIAAKASPAATRDTDEGWHIQIGAVPTMEGARALLETAQESMGAALAAAKPLTQPVRRDGTTLYRARFAGFSGKEEARATCAKLKSKSIACLAVPN